MEKWSVPISGRGRRRCREGSDCRCRVALENAARRHTPTNMVEYREWIQLSNGVSYKHVLLVQGCDTASNAICRT